MVSLPSATTSLIISWSSSLVGFWSNDRMTVAYSCTAMHPIKDSRTCTHNLKITTIYTYDTAKRRKSLAYWPSPSLSDMTEQYEKQKIRGRQYTRAVVAPYMEPLFFPTQNETASLLHRLESCSHLYQRSTIVNFWYYVWGQRNQILNVKPVAHPADLRHAAMASLVAFRSAR